MAKASLSFSIPKFEPDQPDLILQADALVTATGTLQLTKVRDGNPVYESMGRALYAAPVRIWDSKTGNVASFVTSFSFIINATNPSTTADGLAFFLAPVDTQPQGSGGLLGLYPNSDINNLYPVVAVEFDTFSNKDWDPVNTHIGIDVNGIKSKKTIPWNLANGEIANVVISYKASTKTLTATLVYPNSTDDHNSRIVSYTFDLTSALPEFVRVGFSATSGLSAGYKESHDVLSWSFESNLQTAAGTNGGGDDAAHNNAAHASSYGLN